jgi:hypothetical protein
MGRKWDDQKIADAFALSDLEFLTKYPEASADGLARARRRHKHKNGNGTSPVTSVTLDRPTAPPRRKPIPRTLLRAAVFDIETTDFGTGGYKGYLLCTSILPLEADEPYTLRAEYGELNDERLLSEVIAELSQFDILIGHHITAFDLNWLNSRRAFHGMPSLPTWYLYDTYQVAKQLAIKASSKSLANLGDYFQLDGEKTAVREVEWNQVRSPYKEDFEAAMSEIVYHCEQDVILNRNLFDVLWPMYLTANASGLKKTSKW